MWSFETVVFALTAPLPGESVTDAISLPVFDQQSGIGIGVDSFGSGALVLPGQESLISFETSALKFDPWCDATWIEGSMALPKSAVLRCRFDRSDRAIVALVAGLLLSLVDLQERFGDAGKAIWTLRKIFGEGFNAGPSRSAVIGLLGELLVIKSSPSPTAAIDAWHVDADDRYDFSAHSNRLEVKSTTSITREHKFTSRQLPPLHGLDVWIASVQLAEVALGENVSSIFTELSRVLPLEQSRKLADVIIETVGMPPTAVVSPSIDVSTSLSSLRLFVAADVPTPAVVPGSSDLSWSAHLEERLGITELQSVPIFNNIQQLEVDGNGASMENL